MARKYSIAEARDSLAKLVREAEAGREVQLTRRGRSVAVLIGQGEYGRLVSSTRGFSEAYRAFSREVDLPLLAIDPDAVFRLVRDRSPGRNVSL